MILGLVQEKVKLGIANMNIMYYMAEQLMKNRQAFILENNFENMSKDGLFLILKKYSYKAITLTLTGDYEKIYPVSYTHLLPGIPAIRRRLSWG